MEALLIYLVKITICTAVLLGYYYLFLKDKTFHHYNRFYLLSVLPVSLLIPAIRLENFTVEVSPDIYFLIDKMQTLTIENTGHEDIYYSIASAVLGIVSLYFLLKFLLGIFRIHQLKKQFKKEKIQEINFYTTDLTEAPFSYFKNLFWKNSIPVDSEIGKQILKHEMVHIEQKHTVDKIVIELLTAVFWFNPFFHLIKKELSLIHEYLADSRSVNHSNTKAFAQMLMASHFSGTALPATNPFLNSNLKKRLKMLQKPKTKFGYVQRILALPLICTVAFAYMVNAKNKEILQTNIEIEKAVSRMKTDTISPQQKTQMTRKKSNIEKVPGITESSEIAENEYAKFYNEAESKRQNHITKKEELTKAIEANRKKIAFDETFYKQRDYDKNPLTDEEKKQLKDDADKIRDLHVNDQNKVKSSFGLFKIEKSDTKVFDINGNEIKINYKSPVGPTNLMGISLEGAELFVNGKKSK
ncbi:M56 family metallopeptidase [Chryseobacterium arachidis]|uniref:M56 family metallopeptidase n=1 Tax=Chryseobacterium arachidis TaxID=1416778 RepID=UPI0036085D4A